jgi:hypothetical protein
MNIKLINIERLSRDIKFYQICSWLRDGCPQLKVDLGQQELSGFDSMQIETLTDQLGAIHANKISKLSLLLKRKIMLKKILPGQKCWQYSQERISKIWPAKSPEHKNNNIKYKKNQD